MGVAFDREGLLWAFDRLGRSAVAAGAKLEIAVYGGSALMLASNFRYASEDVDITRIEHPWPVWLTDEVRRIAELQGWSRNWLNDAVAFHLSPLANEAGDHVEFGTFPRDDGPPGLVVYVPTAPYMLALKLKAMRVNDPAKGEQEMADIINLMRVLDLRSPDEAIAGMARYFPNSASAPDRYC